MSHHVVLLSSMPHLVTRGGGNYAIRVLSRRWADRGHRVEVITALRGEGPGRLDEETAQALRREWDMPPGTWATVDGCRYLGLDDLGQMARREITQHLFESSPDIVIVAAEDTTGQLFQAALDWDSTRVVALVQTPDLLPGMPLAGAKQDDLLKQMKTCAGAIASSAYVQSLLDSMGIRSRRCYLPVHVDVPVERITASTAGTAITLVNPCEMKGIDLFCALAAARPEYDFLAVRLWGTTDRDLAMLAGLPNITTVEPFESMSDLWTQTRCLVMPSTWNENFPLTLVSALIHGIPSVTSSVGGLREAGMGVARVPELAGSDVSGPDRPRHETERLRGWLSAVDTLMSDREQWEALSRAGHRVATEFVVGIDIENVLHEASDLIEESAKKAAGP